MTRTTVIYGPPGTGKTTRLLELMERELRQGVAPGRIAFVSFTKAAVQEAITRAMKKFDCSRKDLHWFRTLHSMAFAALGVSREAMMTDYSEFAEANGFTLARHRPEGVEAVFAERHTDELLVHAAGLVAATGRTIEEVIRHWKIPVSLSRYEAFTTRLRSWKREHDLMEYSDLIADFNEQQLNIDVAVAFIDEAQDNTPAQWAMIGHAFRNVKRLYVAGDDDQAIYHWAGAEIARMLNLPGTAIVLNHSYRLPNAIHSLALRVASRIQHRKEKVWASNGEPGCVAMNAVLHRIDYDNGETWRFIARTGLTLPDMVTALEQRGALYRFNGELSVPEAQLAALRTVLKLRAGAPCSMSERRRASKFLAEGATFNPWDDFRVLFGKLPGPRQRYLAKIKNPAAAVRIDVSTIHQAKGTEADNVVLSPDLSRATDAALHDQEYSDHEHRVLYVGATRARRRLFVLRPNAEHTYPILRPKEHAESM